MSGRTINGKAVLLRDLTALMRLPIGDKLSLRAFYDEAQLVLRRAKDHGVEVPPAALEWINSAEQRAHDPVLAAEKTNALVSALHTLEH